MNQWVINSFKKYQFVRNLKDIKNETEVLHNAKRIISNIWKRILAQFIQKKKKTNWISVNVLISGKLKGSWIERSSIWTWPVHLLIDSILWYSVVQFCRSSFAWFVPLTNCVLISGPYQVFLKVFLEILQSLCA